MHTVYQRLLLTPKPVAEKILIGSEEMPVHCSTGEFAPLKVKVSNRDSDAEGAVLTSLSPKMPAMVAHGSAHVQFMYDIANVDVFVRQYETCRQEVTVKATAVLS